MEGKLIVFEGIDGSGTSSVSSLVNAVLRELGYRSINTNEPSSSSIGYFIRKYLQNDTFARVKSPEALALLFSADRAEHVYTTIEPKLEQGNIVILDRYIFSTLVYQSLQGADIEIILNANNNFPIPDLMIVLETSPQVAWKRIRQRRKLDSFETLDWIERLAKEYKHVVDWNIKLNRDYLFTLTNRLVVMDSDNNDVENLVFQSLKEIMEILGENAKKVTKELVHEMQGRLNDDYP